MTNDQSRRLFAYSAMSAILFVLRWAIAEPEAMRVFLADPLMSLVDSPIIPFIGAIAAFTALAVLNDRLPQLFAPESWAAAFVVASTVIVVTPSGLPSGLLFLVALLATSSAWTLARNPNASQPLAAPDGVRGIFFLSGMAALVYQVVWQKKLMSLLGADGQAATVIVAVFQAGLGVGALRQRRSASFRRCIGSAMELPL